MDDYEDRRRSRSRRARGRNRDDGSPSRQVPLRRHRRVKEPPASGTPCWDLFCASILGIAVLIIFSWIADLSRPDSIGQAATNGATNTTIPITALESTHVFTGLNDITEQLTEPTALGIPDDWDADVATIESTSTTNLACTASDGLKKQPEASKIPCSNIATVDTPCKAIATIDTPCKDVATIESTCWTNLARTASGRHTKQPEASKVPRADVATIESIATTALNSIAFARHTGQLEDPKVPCVDDATTESTAGIELMSALEPTAKSELTGTSKTRDAIAMMEEVIQQMQASDIIKAIEQERAMMEAIELERATEPAVSTVPNTKSQSAPAIKEAAAIESNSQVYGSRPREAEPTIEHDPSAEHELTAEHHPTAEYSFNGFVNDMTDFMEDYHSSMINRVHTAQSATVQLYPTISYISKMEDFLRTAAYKIDQASPTGGIEAFTLASPHCSNLHSLASNTQLLTTDVQKSMDSMSKHVDKLVEIFQDPTVESDWESKRQTVLDIIDSHLERIHLHQHQAVRHGITPPVTLPPTPPPPKPPITADKCISAVSQIKQEVSTLETFYSAVDLDLTKNIESLKSRLRFWGHSLLWGRWTTMKLSEQDVLQKRLADFRTAFLDKMTREIEELDEAIFEIRSNTIRFDKFRASRSPSGRTVPGLSATPIVRMLNWLSQNITHGLIEMQEKVDQFTPARIDATLQSQPTNAAITNGWLWWPGQSRPVSEGRLPQGRTVDMLTPATRHPQMRQDPPRPDHITEGQP